MLYQLSYVREERILAASRATQWTRGGSCARARGRRAKMLGEFFAARADEIDAGVREEGRWDRFRTVEAKTVSPVSIATLGEIVGVGSFDDLVHVASEGFEAEGGEAGVFSVPDSIRDALAAPELDSPAIAGRWAATDEMTDWSADDVRAVVEALADLSQQAVQEQRQLWFWWSL
jgi:hypothetical protein